MGGWLTVRQPPVPEPGWLMVLVGTLWDGGIREGNVARPGQRDRTHPGP